MRSPLPTVQLKTGHVQPVWAGHPWIYAQAVAQVQGGATAGDEVEVRDPRGNVLGRGFYSPRSAIPVRLLVRDSHTLVTQAFFRERIERAAEWRESHGLPGDDTTGYRVVHAEGDLLPGLIVDRFDDVLVTQFLTFGMYERRRVIAQALAEHFKPHAIVDRTPAAMAKLEGFDLSDPVLYGELPPALAFKERGFAYRLPLEILQKTGFYFDQRNLRSVVEPLARGQRVLDVYSFVGPFAMAAARGGAKSVEAIDTSLLSLEVGAECARMNGLSERITYVRKDAKKALQEAGESGGYDLVIVDPPRLAPSRKNLEGALAAYARLAEMGCRATRPSGTLVLCSCSSAVDIHQLTRALTLGALRANRQAFVFNREFQGTDHPVPSAFGEGLYLKALVARIDAR